MIEQDHYVITVDIKHVYRKGADTASRGSSYPPNLPVTNERVVEEIAAFVTRKGSLAAAIKTAGAHLNVLDEDV